MRLLQTATLQLEEFFASSAIDQRLENQRIPKYAILSHTCELAKAHASLVQTKDSAITRSSK